MPLSGEYEPSTLGWARDQAEQYMKSGGTDGTDLKGVPVILLTTIGAKTGKLRKTPLMRVEHKGEYAIVASLGGAPKHPVWYHNVVKNPRVELQDGTVTRDYDAREVFHYLQHIGYLVAVVSVDLHIVRAFCPDGPS